MYVNPRPPIHPLTSPSLRPETGLSEALFRASASLASLSYLLLHPHHISGLWLLHVVPAPTMPFPPPLLCQLLPILWESAPAPLPTAAGRDGRALPPILATPPLSPIRAPAILWPGSVCCSLSLTQMSACSPSLTHAWIAHAQPMIGAQHLLQLFLDKEEKSPHPGSLPQPWASRGSGPQRLRGRQPPSPLILRLLPLLL